MTAPAVLVCTTAFAGKIDMEHHSSYLALEQWALERGVRLGEYIYADSNIDRARNACLGLFMKQTDFTHFLFVDADISFPPEAVERLLYLDRDIGGVAYRRRGGTGHVVEFEGEAVNGRIEVKTSEGFAVAKYIGTGFMMVKRDAFTKMIAAYPEREYVNDDPTIPLKETWDLFSTFVLNRRLLSEDYGFCHLAKAIGLEIWVDLQTSLAHKTSDTLKGSFMETAQKIAPKKVVDVKLIEPYI